MPRAPTDVLSDDTIVDKLREAGIDIARRTVAKYREAMRIPSSVQRRREKQALAARHLMQPGPRDTKGCVDCAVRLDA